MDELEKDNLQQPEKDGQKPFNLKREIISWILVVVTAFLLAFVTTHYVIIKAEVPSGSMENTIMTGDRIVGNRLAYLLTEPKRGDIVIFKFPDDETQNYVKRVIGLPGETVQVTDGVVYINGEPLEEDYLKEEMYGNTEEFVVPEGSYFMMGDNRNSSYDSRKWENSYVEEEKILGKAWFRYSPSFDMLK